MSDEDLIGYLFDLLDPNERAAVAACVEADPAVAARLEQLRVSASPMLAVMEAEREEPPEPPAGLALRAIGAVAAHVVEHEPRKSQVVTESAIAAFLREYSADEPKELDFDSGTRAKRPRSASDPGPAPPPTDGPEYRSGLRLRADLLVAACIAFVGFGLVMSGIAKARHNQRVIACQNNLRTLYGGLADYAEANQGRYPQIGTPTHPTADTFSSSLVDMGYLPAGYKPGCPVAPETLAYTYTLGFRSPTDELVGLRKPTENSACEEIDQMPIAADCPSSSASPGAGPVSQHGGSMNVLFVGGNVRLTTSPNVGPRGDDIYRNVYGHVAAGANPNDAVLGRPGDRP
jgi:prepilin-type processing-associated H-X9-DG protein